MIFDKYEKQGAYHYDWLNDNNWRWYQDCAAKIENFCRGAKTALDVGCGDGAISEALGHIGIPTTGIDNDPRSIELAKEYPNQFSNEFYVHDLAEPLLGTWEYMVCLNVIEHLDSPDGLVGIIRDNITRGAIIITDKAIGHKGRYHEHEYTKKELLATFEEFNPKYFEINSTEFGNPITFIGVEILK